MTVRTYSGVAATLEKAVGLAHAKILAHQGKDFTVSKVSSWGMQFGGFTEQTRFWVEIEEDPDATLRPDG